MDVLELLNEIWMFLHPESSLDLQLSFWTGAGSGLLSAAGSLFSGLFGNKAQREANATNLQIARETNENQYKMFKEGNEFSQRMAQEAWNRETSYNDPRAQLERYARAGINGQVAMSGSLGSAGTQPADMAAPQSLAPPTLHAPTVAPVPTPFDMQSMATILDTLASADKKGAETSRIRGLYETELENAMEDVKYKKLQNTYQNIQNNILNKTGLDKAFAELRESNSRILLNDKMTETEKYKQLDLDAAAFLKRAEGRLTSEKYSQLVETFPLLKRQLEEQVKLTVEQQKTEQSKQNANNAAADDSRAGAGLKRQMTQTEKENTRKAHWEKVAASWNALDAKTSAQLNKKYGSAERVQALISSEVENFSKSHKLANPSDIYNFGNKLYDNLLNKLGLSDYNGIDRTAVGRNLQQAIEDELRMRYDIYE